MDSTEVILVVSAASIVLGTIGGTLEKLCTPGGVSYKIGIVLGSLGVDLASLGKLAGGVK